MSKIEINRNDCVACHRCVDDCVAGVISVDEAGFPVTSPETESRCIGCQHCLAICPTGALSFEGIHGSELPRFGALPEGSLVMNLLRQRRSVRHYADENLPPEVLDQLLSCLAWVPTGCNDHSLRFAVVRERSEMCFFRSELVRGLRFLRRWGIVRLLFPKYRGAVDAVIEGSDLVFRGAPHMIVASVRRHAPCHEADPWIALSQFEVLAQSLGVGTCWCGFGVHAMKRMKSMRDRLGIPEEHEVGAVMLFGKPAVSYARPTHPHRFEIGCLGS